MVWNRWKRPSLTGVCVLCIRNIFPTPVPEKMPILQDLYDLLRGQDEPEAQRLATALEIYVTGSLNVFNHRTKRGYQ